MSKIEPPQQQTQHYFTTAACTYVPSGRPRTSASVLVLGRTKNGPTSLLGGGVLCTNNTLFSSNNNTHPQQQQIRCYTPLTKDEEEQEKTRAAGLSDFAKDQELRKLNREIARLEMLRGINTGELYTWSGRYKQLARDYGMPLFAWYWACWFSTAIVCYGAITVFNVDTIALLAQIDAKTGWALVEKVDPTMGKIGMTVIVNEAIEPLRLPFVIVTCKPVVDRIAPRKF